MPATAPRPFSLAAHLRAGHSCLAAWMQLADPMVAEVFAREEFGCVIFDMQHGMGDVASTMRGIGAVNHAGKAAGVRLQMDDDSNGARYLDNGAELVIAPMINSVEAAQRFARAMKYPPRGERSWGPGRTLMLAGQAPLAYMQGANDATLALAMIETREALDAVDAILAIDGIDGVFLGPSDMSIAISHGGRLDAHHPSVTEAADLILKAARRAGKIAGSYGGSLAMARDMIAKGWQLVSVTNDVQIIREGIRVALAEAEGRSL